MAQEKENVKKGKIFFIHGMMTGPWCFEELAGHLEKMDWQCVVPALRFHEVPGANFSDNLAETGLLDYIIDLEKILKIEKEPIILIGHSMGGLLGEILFSRGFGRLAVFLSPAPSRGINFLNFNVARSFFGVFFRWKFWKKPFKFDFKKICWSALGGLNKAEQEKIFKEMVWESGRVLKEIAFPFFDGKKASFVDYSKMDKPALFVGAEKDRMVPKKSVIRAAKKVSNSEYWELKGKHHWFLSGPGSFELAEKIDEWLTKKSQIGENR